MKKSSRRIQTIVAADHGQEQTSETKQLQQRPWTDKIAGQSPDTIEVLKEILGSLRITKDNMLNKSTELAIPETKEMLTAPVLAVYNKNIQTITPKSIVPDLGQFDGDRTKFKNWWRGI